MSSAHGATGSSRPAVRTLVTTRAGGVSEPPFDAFNLSDGVSDLPAAVGANRAALVARIRLPPGRIVWMHQVHGTDVRIVSAAPDGPLEATDGIVTAAPGLALAVLVADCVPVLAADPTAGVIGAAHAGRRGAAGGIAGSLIRRMAELGAQPSRIEVRLGPAICGACYEVPAAMAAEVDAALPGSACSTHQGTPGLDLRAGLAAQLTAWGVTSVLVDPRCTREDAELFSHRRDAPTGRSAALIWLDPRDAGAAAGAPGASTPAVVADPPNAGVSQQHPPADGR